MYDHFRPPDHFTFWQALAYRLSGAAIVIAGLVLIAVYVLPWLDARYFSPAIDWFLPRYTAFFGGREVLATIVFFLIIGAPWAASHLYARRLAKRNREKASADASQ
jgi:hypothetical protein